MPSGSKSALLLEYETCAHELVSTVNNYWTSASIFIGITTAILAGLVYGLLANKALLLTLVNTTTFDAPATIIFLRVAVTMFGLVSITILSLMLAWLKRLYFVIDLVGFRMRQIEEEKGFGMWRSKLSFYIDKWEDKKDSLPNKDKQSFLQYLGVKRRATSIKTMSDLMNELSPIMHMKLRYHKPIRKGLAWAIFYTLITAWVVAISGVWIFVFF